MALVDEYVESAAPVGSSRIAQQYLTEVSPATIRNELMGLETEGYALSPHTSAGRIPTNIGYRVFVNALLLRESLRSAGKMSGDMPRGDLGWEIGREIVTPGVVSPQDIELRELRDLRAMDAEQRIERVLAFLSEATGLLSVLWYVRPEVRVHHRGMPHLLAQPEFQDARALIPLMQLMEDEAALAQLLISTHRSNGFVVKVGIEDEDGRLSSYSMIAEVYGDERPRGALAVFGPTRMDYRRAIPAVLFASRLLDYPRARSFG
jgi:heat-inducible transcriptional repressor